MQVNLIPKKYKRFIKPRYYKWLIEQKKYSTANWDAGVLSSYDAKKFDEAEILFGFSSRFKGNPNSFLPDTVEAIYKHATNPEKIAVSVVVDPDDSLGFYQEYKLKNPDKNIRFFIAPERYGIEGLHKYDKIIFDNLPEKCTIFFDYSDDALITLQGFDDYLLGLNRQYQDNIFVVHTREYPYNWLPDMSENKADIPLLHKICSPSSLFPIVSRNIIEIARKVAGNSEDAAEWSPLSNSWIYDCYVDYIGYSIMAAGFKDRVKHKDMCKRITRNDKFNSYNEMRDKNHLTRNERALFKMHTSRTLNVLNEICEGIAGAINK